VSRPAGQNHRHALALWSPRQRRLPAHSAHATETMWRWSGPDAFGASAEPSWCSLPDRVALKAAIAKAETVAKETPNSWIPQQFENPSNQGSSPKPPREEEIWVITAGR